MEIDSTESVPHPFVRTSSEKEFIANNNLDLHKPSDSLNYVKYLLEKIVDV
jgi:hypothetical protein